MPHVVHSGTSRRAAQTASSLCFPGSQRLLYQIVLVLPKDPEPNPREISPCPSWVSPWVYVYFFPNIDNNLFRKRFFVLTFHQTLSQSAQQSRKSTYWFQSVNVNFPPSTPSIRRRQANAIFSKSKNQLVFVQVVFKRPLVLNLLQLYRHVIPCY